MLGCCTDRESSYRLRKAREGESPLVIWGEQLTEAEASSFLSLYLTLKGLGSPNPRTWKPAGTRPLAGPTWKDPPPHRTRRDPGILQEGSTKVGLQKWTALRPNPSWMPAAATQPKTETWGLAPQGPPQPVTEGVLGACSGALAGRGGGRQ